MKLPPALRHAAFREYLAGSFVSNIGNSIQAWTIAWHIYVLTNDSLLVGLLGLVRVAPLLVFTLFGGVVADQLDRRKVMLVTQAAMALVSLGLLGLSLLDVRHVAPFYALVALNAVARAFDGPARQALQVGLVPLHDYANAASLNGVAWRLSDVLGPLIAGLVIGSQGIGRMSGTSVCFLLNAVSFGALLWVVWRMPPQREVPKEDRPKSIRDVLQLIREGLHFVNRTPVVRSAMWIDFWATLFSGADALLPALAKDHLKLGSQGFGLLGSSSAMGALIAAAVLAWRHPPLKQGRLVVVMIAAYGFFTICLGLSQTLWAAALSLAAVGAADMVSTVMRQTIRQLATPDALRGRMNATSSLFHISGPQLGDFEAGAVARLWGERASILIGGVLCMAVAVHWSRATALVGYRHERREAPGTGP